MRSPQKSPSLSRTAVEQTSKQRFARSTRHAIFGSMPIFTQRRLCSMLTEFSSQLTPDKFNELVSRLEHVNTRTALAAEAELAVLWAASRVAHIVSEPVLPHSTRRRFKHLTSFQNPSLRKSRQFSRFTTGPYFFSAGSKQPIASATPLLPLDFDAHAIFLSRHPACTLRRQSSNSRSVRTSVGGRPARAHGLAELPESPALHTY